MINTNLNHSEPRFYFNRQMMISVEPNLPDGENKKFQELEEDKKY